MVPWTGTYGVRGGMQNETLYGKETDFWSGLECLTSRNIEIAYNEIRNVLRDTNDGGAIEGWGTGRDNAWHSNCISDLSPGVLDLGTRCKHNSRSLLAS